MWFGAGGERASERWLLPSLSAVPPEPQQEAIAAELGQQLGRTGLQPADLISEVGWTVECNALAAASGGLRAMLVPMLCGGFTVLIDPVLTPYERLSGACPNRVRALRLAHEIGHTAFYLRGEPPRRLTSESPEEEHFCDLFALAMVNAYGEINESARVRQLAQLG